MATTCRNCGERVEVALDGEWMHMQDGRRQCALVADGRLIPGAWHRPDGLTQADVWERIEQHLRRIADCMSTDMRIRHAERKRSVAWYADQLERDHHAPMYQSALREAEQRLADLEAAHPWLREEQHGDMP